MNIYLADSSASLRHRVSESPLTGAKILQSFYYADAWTEKIIPLLKSFMLDSGAFTFFGTGGGVIDWAEYVKKYAAFINRNDVKLFFELDIDPLIGYKNVLYYRSMLEDLTGRPCIPVWHKSRGFDEYVKMCEQYNYVAIGGIVSREITQKDYKFFTPLISTAHKNGAKVHGLGFTNLTGLTKYHFDSVDSTAWVSGNRFGHVYKFDGKTMQKIGRQEGQRMVAQKAAALNNFLEWKKFSDWAETHL